MAFNIFIIALQRFQALRFAISFSVIFMSQSAFIPILYMLFSNRQALISSYKLFHHRLLTNCVWHRHLITTNDDPEIMHQCPINICVKIVSVLEDKSEDSLRHVNCIFIHISHNSQYYICFSGYGKLYFRSFRFPATMRFDRRRLTLRCAASLSFTRSSYL